MWRCCPLSAEDLVVTLDEIFHTISLEYRVDLDMLTTVVNILVDSQILKFSEDSERRTVYLMNATTV
jgi:hypothetical protein